MNTALPLFAIGLIFGGGIGFTIAAANGITLNGHDHSDPAQHATADAGHNTHAHNSVLKIEPSASAPTLDADVTKDPASGWNLHIRASNFLFSPENASLGHIEGEGHAHVYVNGVKLGRFYGPWVHLDNLPEGRVDVDVTLNSNDHRTLSVGDKKLKVRATLQN